MNIRTISRLTAIAASILALGGGSLGCAVDAGEEISAEGQAAASGVLPPSAAPHGMTLTDMIPEVAPFMTSGNDLAYYPSTPFQLLYADWSNTEFTVEPDGDGQRASIQGVNHFTVPTGTFFHLLAYNLDDSPPVYGPFPTDNEQARAYYFGQQGLSAEYWVEVDGKARKLGPDYVVGPAETSPLLDGGGTHDCMLATFIGPLSPGDHEIRLYGAVSGDAILATTGFTVVEGDLLFKVHVVKQHTQSQ